MTSVFIACPFVCDLNLKLYCGYKYTRPCMINRIWFDFWRRDIFSICFACFPSFQLDGALANEIKHDHLPVVIVVLDPRYD